MKDFVTAVIVVVVILLISSFLSPHEVKAEVLPNYYIKQISTGGATRHNVTNYPVLSDVSNVPAISKTEKTVATTWNSEPMYFLKDVTGSKVTYIKTAVPIKFIEDQPLPPKEECRPRGYDAIYKGVRLFINPTPQEPDPCYCLGMKTVNNVDSFSMFQCWQINSNGSRTCPAN